MAQLHGSGAREPTSRPDGEDKRLSGPVLPLFTEIVAMRICPAGRERERGVADHEHCVMGQRGESVEILGLGAGCGESRLDLPHVTTQDLEQRHGCARRCGEEDGPIVQLCDRPTAEQRDAADRAVTGNREIGQEHKILGVPCILDRADHAHVQLAGNEQVVQLGGRARHQLAARRQRHDAAVDRPVDRRAVDVADSSNPQAIPRLKPGPGEALSLRTVLCWGHASACRLIRHHPRRSSPAACPSR